MPQPIQLNGAALDLSPRLFSTATVAASPAAATETTIASITINEDLFSLEGVVLFGWAAFTIGASGVSAQLKIRRTNTSGATVKDSGATTIGAAELGALSIAGVDANQTPVNTVYVLTLTVASGAAPSTVSAVTLVALVV